MAVNATTDTLHISVIDTPLGLHPKFESIGMGSATSLCLTFNSIQTATLIGIAGKSTKRKGKLKFEGYISRPPKRLVAGMHGEKPLIEHDFVTGGEMFFQGRLVNTLVIDCGLDLNNDKRFLLSPNLKLSLHDSDDHEDINVQYINVEFWPVTKANQMCIASPSQIRKWEANGFGI
jgi:hypothetical protein